MSTPAFGASPTSPALTYVMATEQDVGGRHTTDDNWETYGHGDGRPHYAPTVSTDLGEKSQPRVVENLVAREQPPARTTAISSSSQRYPQMSSSYSAGK
jgi:hypothetical protein